MLAGSLSSSSSPRLCEGRAHSSRQVGGLLGVGRWHAWTQTMTTIRTAGDKCSNLLIDETLVTCTGAPTVSPTAVNASEKFLGQRDDDARRASHVAKSVLVFVLGHLADEFGALGAQASDSVVNAFDCKHDAPET
jgi:hypothetical protein